VFAEALRERLVGLVELSSAQIEALETHYNLMVRWNKTLNLTKITDAREAVARHYAESLFLGVHLPAQILTIADIGSGPGFPGIPVAVLRPDCEVALIEAHQRKSVFLREVSRGMNNVRVISKRAEEVEDRFEWMISRAVSYEDLTGSIGSLCRASALLTGEEAPPAKWGWRWDPSIIVPGGRSRFLRIGYK
jgi:16S rRNA (guanine527-N7)-methyltransferase